MTFDEYQEETNRTANTSLGQKDALTQLALGLAGESGECIDTIKKHVYHDHPMDLAAMAKELGDVLWYLTQISEIIGVPLSVVAEMNVEKLRLRYPNGFNNADSIKRADKP